MVWRGGVEEDGWLGDDEDEEYVDWLDEVCKGIVSDPVCSTPSIRVLSLSTLLMPASLAILPQSWALKPSSVRWLNASPMMSSPTFIPAGEAGSFVGAKSGERFINGFMLTPRPILGLIIDAKGASLPSDGGVAGPVLDGGDELGGLSVRTGPGLPESCSAVGKTSGMSVVWT